MRRLVEGRNGRDRARYIERYVCAFFDLRQYVSDMKSRKVAVYHDAVTLLAQSLRDKAIQEFPLGPEPV
jgi:hypothetical protein